MHLSTCLIELHFIRLHEWVLPTTNKVSHKQVCSIHRTHASLSCFTMCFVSKNELFRAGTGWGPAIRAIQGDERVDLLTVRPRGCHILHQACFKGFTEMSSHAHRETWAVSLPTLNCLRRQSFQGMGINAPKIVYAKECSDKKCWKLFSILNKKAPSRNLPTVTQ